MIARTDIDGATLRALTRRVADLATRAKRLRMEPVPALTVTREYRAPVAADPFGRTEARYDVTIAGPVARIVRPGWALRAVAKPAIDGADMGDGPRMVYGFGPLSPSIAARLMTGAAECEECRAVRRRRMLLAVEETATGAVRVIGSDCARLYVAGSEAELETLADMIGLESARATEEDADCDADGHPSRPTWPLARIVEVTIWHLRTAPYIPTSSISPLPTRDEVAHVLGKDGDKARKAFTAERDAAIERDRDAVIAWMRAKGAGVRYDRIGDPVDGYAANIGALAEAGIVGARTLGLAVSAVAGWRRDAEQRAAAERQAAGGPVQVGTPGKREDFGRAVIVATSAHDGQYGTTYRVVFRLDAAPAAEVIWWASSPPMLTLPDGRQAGLIVLRDEHIPVRVKATVKEHGEFRGRPQTVLSRAVVSVI